MFKALFLLLIIFCLAWPVYAAAPSVYIPAEARLIVPDKDFVQVICLESKWRGGEAIAAIEAVGAALDKAFKELEKFGINLDSSAYLDSVSSFKDSFESICSSATVEQALAAVDEFKKQAQNLRGSLQTNLAIRLRRDIEGLFGEKKEKIKKSFEKELEDYSVKLQQEMEKRSQGRISVEDEGLKKELEERIRARVSAEVNRQASGDSSPDPAYYMELGRQLGEKFKAEEDARHKDELKTLSDGITAAEKQKLEQMINDFIETKTKEIDKVRDRLENIGAEIEALKEQKRADWLSYRDLAVEAKKQIIEKIINHYFSQAEEMILAKKETIEQARAKEETGDLKIMSTDELLAKLNQDKQAVMNLLMNGEINAGKIEQVKNEFANKWNEIRSEMEKIEAKSGAVVIDKITEYIDWKRIEKQLSENLLNAAGLKSTYGPLVERCQTKPDIFEPTNKEEAGDCTYCKNENELNQMLGLAGRIEAQINVCLGIINELKQYQANKTEISIKEALAFKDKLVSEFEKLRQLQSEYNNLNDVYKNNFNIARQQCFDYLNK